MSENRSKTVEMDRIFRFRFLNTEIIGFGFGFEISEGEVSVSVNRPIPEFRWFLLTGRFLFGIRYLLTDLKFETHILRAFTI